MSAEFTVVIRLLVDMSGGTEMTKQNINVSCSKNTHHFHKKSMVVRVKWVYPSATVFARQCSLARCSLGKHWTVSCVITRVILVLGDNTHTHSINNLYQIGALFCLPLLQLTPSDLIFGGVMPLLLSEQSPLEWTNKKNAIQTEQNLKVMDSTRELLFYGASTAKIISAKMRWINHSV